VIRMSFIYFESGRFLKCTLERARPCFHDRHVLRGIGKNLVMMAMMGKVQEDVTG
jgi:hypothetical protein